MPLYSHATRPRADYPFGRSLRGLSGRPTVRVCATATGCPAVGLSVRLSVCQSVRPSVCSTAVRRRSIDLCGGDLRPIPTARARNKIRTRPDSNASEQSGPAACEEHGRGSRPVPRRHTRTRSTPARPHSNREPLRHQPLQRHHDKNGFSWPLARQQQTSAESAQRQTSRTYSCKEAKPPQPLTSGRLSISLVRRRNTLSQTALKRSKQAGSWPSPSAAWAKAADAAPDPSGPREQI